MTVVCDAAFAEPHHHPAVRQGVHLSLETPHRLQPLVHSVVLVPGHLVVIILGHLVVFSRQRNLYLPQVQVCTGV